MFQHPKYIKFMHKNRQYFPYGFMSNICLIKEIKKAVSAIIVMREKSLTQITILWHLVNGTTCYTIINILNLS